MNPGKGNGKPVGKFVNCGNVGLVTFNKFENCGNVNGKPVGKLVNCGKLNEPLIAPEKGNGNPVGKFVNGGNVGLLPFNKFENCGNVAGKPVGRLVNCGKLNEPLIAPGKGNGNLVEKFDGLTVWNGNELFNPGNVNCNPVVNWNGLVVKLKLGKENCGNENAELLNDGNGWDNGKLNALDEKLNDGILNWNEPFGLKNDDALLRRFDNCGGNVNAVGNVSGLNVAIERFRPGLGKGGNENDDPDEFLTNEEIKSINLRLSICCWHDIIFSKDKITNVLINSFIFVSKIFLCLKKIYFILL